MNSENQDITYLLNQWTQGDQEAFKQLIPLVYSELRKVAIHCLEGERRNHTLQVTSLINEVYLRLQKSGGLHFPSRRQFFSFAAQTMRRILVEHARTKNRQKRGGQQLKVPLEEARDFGINRWDPALVLTLDHALTRLKRVDDRKSSILEMWYFAGLSQEELSAHFEVSPTTIKRELRAAKCWLAHEMEA